MKPMAAVVRWYLEMKRKKGRRRAVCCGLRREVRVLGINEEAQEKKKSQQKCAVLRQPHYGSPSRGGRTGRGLRHQEKKLSHPA